MNLLSKVPNSILVAQALTLSYQASGSFISKPEQEGRFLPSMNNRCEMVSGGHLYSADQVAEFLSDQIGTSKDSEILLQWFETDLSAYHFMNVINYCTEMKAVLFCDEGTSDYCAAVEFPYGIDRYKEFNELAMLSII